MRVKCIDKGTNNAIENGKIYNVIKETGDSYHLDIDCFESVGYKKTRFEVVNELSLQQVLNVINIGDTYESQNHYIKVNSCGGLIICNKTYDDNRVRVIIQSDEVFNLKRETFEFEDALDSLHDGQIIESVVTGFKFKMEKGKYKSFIANNWVTLTDEQLTFEMR